MGKIFKALEKSQHRADKNKEVEKNRSESLPDVHDRENIKKNAIKVQPVLTDPIAPDHRTVDSHIIDPMLVAALNPQSIESEQFRQLKNSILFPEKSNVPKCIMITSTSPGEGKSFVAANLAISLSQSIDEYVL